MLPRYCVTFVKKNRLIIWRDPQVYNQSNHQVLNQIRDDGYTIYCAQSSKDALTVLACKRSDQSNKVFVITHGADNSEKFIQNVREKYHCNEEVLVFTGSYQFKDNYEKFSNVKKV